MALASELSELPQLKTSTADDPKVVAEQHADDYSNHLVPLTARVGKWQLTMSFWSLLSAMVWLFYGALVSGLYGTRDALIAIVASAVTYSLVNILFTRWGIRSGLNSTLLSRRMFGAVGAALTAFLVAANTTYYAVFESSTLAVAFAHYTPGWDIRIWYAIVVVAMLPLMLGGVQSWLARLNGILLPFYAVGMFAAVVVTAIRFPVGGDWLAFEGVVPPVAREYPGWMLGFVLYMGIWLLMPTTVDFARFGKIEDQAFHEKVTFGWVFYSGLFVLNGVAGIFLVRSVIPDQPAAETGVVQAILASMGVVGLILIVVSQTRINSLNYYLASANWSRLVGGLTGLQVHRVVWVVATTVVVFLLMLTDVFSYLQTALTWQGVLIVGWVTIVFTHFALCPADREAGPEFRAGRLPRFTPGLAVWIIASAIGIWLIEAPSAPTSLSAIAPVVVLALCVALYVPVLKLLPNRTGSAVSDPRTEVGDHTSTWIECHHCEKSYVATEMDRLPVTHEPVCDDCATASRVHRHR